MQEVVVGDSGRKKSPPTSWLTGMTGVDAPSFAERLRRAQSFDRGPVDEAAEAQVEEGAQLDELVHAHLALTVQDVPEPLPVHADAARQFGARESSQLPCAIHDASNAAFVDHARNTNMPALAAHQFHSETDQSRQAGDLKAALHRRQLARNLDMLRALLNAGSAPDAIAREASIAHHGS